MNVKLSLVEALAGRPQYGRCVMNRDKKRSLAFSLEGCDATEQETQDACVLLEKYFGVPLGTVVVTVGPWR
jgi:hypothetical protein